MQLKIDVMQRLSVHAQKADKYHCITVRETFYIWKKISHIDYLMHCRDILHRVWLVRYRKYQKERNQSVCGSQKYLIIKTRLYVDALSPDQYPFCNIGDGKFCPSSETQGQDDANFSGEHFTTEWESALPLLLKLFSQK